MQPRTSPIQIAGGSSLQPPKDQLDELSAQCSGTRIHLCPRTGLCLPLAITQRKPTGRGRITKALPKGYQRVGKLRPGQESTLKSSFLLPAQCGVRMFTAKVENRRM